ncbi:MAG: 16S rRNA (uracil(1498)-N(3))-methyltransferase [Opitutaceae bacterium]|jgi:16S rRNA (uracil1498-N3)-methyltransferase|nr:16S rRNA (uracil(1498)-N(3))-methyltransferase [Opitutaceae bacterium]
MPDFRAYCPTGSTGPAEKTVPRELRLDAAESHHLVVVNRARAGDPVVVFDGRGREWSGTLAAAGKRAAVIAIRAEHRRVAPLPCAVTLAQALPKGSSVMDDIVRHATELGVARIVPLETVRTQVHLEADRSGKKLGKWRAAALEACKQCGNPWLPDIAPVQTLAAFLTPSPALPASAAPATAADADADGSGYGGDTDAGNDGVGNELRLIASLHPGAHHLREVVAEARALAGGLLPVRAVWLIGPEGDFTTEEMAAALAAGFRPVTLGPLVLRCDTAATSALATLNHEML